jgi:hypothetical protein
VQKARFEESETFCPSQRLIKIRSASGRFDDARPAMMATLMDAVERTTVATVAPPTIVAEPSSIPAQPYGALAFRTLGLPPVPPFRMTDRTARMGILRQTLAGFSRQVAPALEVSRFIRLDLPAAHPLFETSRSTRIGIAGEALSRFRGQIVSSSSL